MTPTNGNGAIKQPSDTVVNYVRKDFFKLHQDLTVEQALDEVRREAPTDGVLYFYVVDDNDRLVGVLPTRRLLTASGRVHLDALAVPNVIAITHRATVADACEMFLKHKFLAFPVVDDALRVVGLVDISLFAEEIVDLTERKKADELFEMIGFRAALLKKASAIDIWRYRFPWLLATIISGTICAFVAAAFEKTLTHSIVLAFFMTLVLALGESVSIQSMSLAIQRLRFMKPSLPWYFSMLWEDGPSTLLIALSSGVLVALVVSLIKGIGPPTAVIGGSIFLSVLSAGVLGLSVPSALHALKLDPKVSAGPLTLAITDGFTILIYLVMGAVALR